MSQFITPVSGALTQPFIAGKHEGVDIGASDHSPVVAAEAGTVTYVGLWGLGGNTLIIKGLDGWTTYYCHLAQFLVTKGSSIKQGQEIALSGGALGEVGAGNATGPHLHFEIHTPAGNPIDPQTLISVGGQATTSTPVPKTASPSILNDIKNYLIFGAGGIDKKIPVINKVSQGISTADSAAKGIDSTTKAANFLTTSSNWKRIGLFVAGAAILTLVLAKTLSESSSIKDISKAAAVAA